MDDPRMEAGPPTASSAEKPLLPTQRSIEDSLTTGKGVKETIESILIAFILAFVFRAFVVEAFVIPTGSMATTLLGAHMRFTCRECGYVFDVSYQNNRASSGDDIDIPSRYGPEYVKGKDGGLEAIHKTVDAYCPNCRFKVPAPDCVDPFIRYGDRILVLKYQYMVSAPRRWDVVVFKTPANTLPGAPLYTVNYIKRLIGLPGERLMLLKGDVYVEEPQEPDEWRRWKIQAKPRHAQDALWRVIYDHDYRPLESTMVSVMTPSGVPTEMARGGDGWRLPWAHGVRDGAGWDTGDATHARVIKFDNASGWGRLRFDPTTAPKGASRAPGGYFTDWLAYDALLQDSSSRAYTMTDLRLCFSYQREAGTGPLRATLTKLGHEFSLEIDGEHIRLLHKPPGEGAHEVRALKEIRASSSAPMRVEFANADYRVSVRIDDELAFETTGDEYAPDVKALMNHNEERDPLPLPAVEIYAEKQKASLSHVSLWRDVYYTPSGNGAWHGAEPKHSTQLGPEEYFVLGDNSAASSDARFWPDQVNLPQENLSTPAGRVPGRFMLGRAFFVYWPAGYRPIEAAPALIPDFGEMRLIH